MEFRDYFRACIELVEEAKVEYLIIGGIAVGVFGEPRFTQDVDIIIFIKKPELGSFLVRAEEMGFSFDRKMVLSEAKERGVFRLFLEDLHLDLLIAYTELERRALKRKVSVKIFDKDVFLPSKEDLLLLKIIPNRLRDLIDAEGIALRHKGRLDRKYLESWAQKISDEAEDMAIWNRLMKVLKE